MTTRSSRRIRVAASLASTLLLLGNTQCGAEDPPAVGNGDDVTSGIPLADYGDAPDGFPTNYLLSSPGVASMGAFPSAFSTTNASAPGAHTLNSSQEFLGARVTAERGVLDSDDPDLTENMTNDDSGDDGLVGLWSENGVFGVDVLVTLAPSAPAGTRYVNVLLDVNGDGTWTDEWNVVNFAVDAVPGETTSVRLPGTWTGPRKEAWSRILLTREPLPEAGWDGSGAFAFGEVEDHLLHRPALAFDMDWIWDLRTDLDEDSDEAIAFAAAITAMRVDAEASAAALAATLVEVEAQAIAVASDSAAASASAAAVAAYEALAQAEASSAASASAAASVE
ncbi:MAG: hypothetical protein KDA24_26255, partial [Deltaproteobacteria bacterium]|nr:hypothetical protein [Deltaproteobacteria bacterium]